MGFGTRRGIEYPGHFGMQEFGVLGIDHEPAKLRRKGLDQPDIVDEAPEKYRFGHPVVPRLGRIRDEIATLEALFERARMSTGRSTGADRDDQEQQGGEHAHRVCRLPRSYSDARSGWKDCVLIPA